MMRNRDFPHVGNSGFLAERRPIDYPHTSIAKLAHAGTLADDITNYHNGHLEIA